MNVKTLRLLLYLFLLSLGACHPEKSQLRELDMAQSMVEEQPDTALCILQRIAEPQRLTGREYATYCLLRTQAEDNNGVTHTSDELIRVAVDYFGKQNEPLLASQAYFYLARVNEEMGNDSLAVVNYQTALVESRKTKAYKQTAAVCTHLSVVYQRISRFDEAIDMQKQAYSNQLLAESEQTEALTYAVIGGVLIGLIISLLFIMYYRRRIKGERMVAQSCRKALDAAERAVSEGQLEAVGLRKDIHLLRRSLYHSDELVRKIRGFNELGFLPKNRLHLTEQEWHRYFGLLDEAFGFISRLKEQYPKLTDDDLRVCALLREGVTAARISTVLQMTPEALTRRMQRLKSEKLGMGEQKASLETILGRF